MAAQIQGEITVIASLEMAENIFKIGKTFFLSVQQQKKRFIVLRIVIFGVYCPIIIGFKNYEFGALRRYGHACCGSHR